MVKGAPLASFGLGFSVTLGGSAEVEELVGCRVLNEVSEDG
jgi:hypothetical protein